MATPKHESILGLLAMLSAELEPSLWEVVDHWEMDMHAIGIARRGRPDVLAYVCTWGQPPGHCSCSFELPPAPGSEFPYRPAGDLESVSFAQAVRRIREHLSGVAHA